MMDEIDVKLQEFEKVVEQLESEIASKTVSTNRSWKTVCRYKMTSDNLINIATANSQQLVDICADLMIYKQHQTAAHLELFGSAPTQELMIKGHTYSEWLDDLKLRVEVIELVNTKNKLSRLKQTISELKSDELKRRNRFDDLEMEMSRL